MVDGTQAAPDTTGTRIPAIAWTLLVFALFVFRVLAVAHWDIYTAQAIVADSDTAKTVIGTVLPLLPLWVVLGFAVAPGWLKSISHPLGREAVAAIPWWLTAAWVVAYSAPIFGGLLVSLAAYAVVNQRKADRKAEQPRSWADRVLPLSSVLLVGAASAVFVFDSPWLPREVITYGPDRHTAVGYVLSADDGGWMSLLRDKDHGVQRIRSTDVATRAICGGGSGFWSTTIAEYIHLSRSPSYHRCPS